MAVGRRGRARVCDGTPEPHRAPGRCHLGHVERRPLNEPLSFVCSTLLQAPTVIRLRLRCGHDQWLRHRGYLTLSTRRLRRVIYILRPSCPRKDEGWTRPSSMDGTAPQVISHKELSATTCCARWLAARCLPWQQPGLAVSCAHPAAVPSPSRQMNAAAAMSP